MCVYGGFPTLGVPFLGSPYNTDYSILGSILGYPNLGKLPISRQTKRAILRIFDGGDPCYGAQASTA